MHESSASRAGLLGSCIDTSIMQIERHAHHIMSRSSRRTLRSCFRQTTRRTISVSVSLADPFCVSPLMSWLPDLTRFMSLWWPLPLRLKEPVEPAEPVEWVQDGLRPEKWPFFSGLAAAAAAAAAAGVTEAQDGLRPEK